MSAPQWAWESARRFWAEAGGWSRDADLEAAIDRVVSSVRVDGLAGLSTSRVRDHLARRGYSTPEVVPDRRLRGCVLTLDGAGWIVLDADDPADERRFSLAHELAHLLRHHLASLEYRGDAGRRLRGVLRGVRSLHYLHLMERGDGFLSSEVHEAEEEADWLAVELLAPEEELSPRLRPDATRDEIAAVLREAFGLPKSAASAHADRLVPEVGECPLIARLKKY